AKVARCRLRNISASKPSFDRHAKADFLFEGGTPVGDEIIAGVRAAVRIWVTGRLRFFARALRLSNRPPSNFTLIVRCATREFFDCPPVTISGREVRSGKTRVGPKDRVDQTHALEEFRPVEGGNQPHA